MLDRRYDMAFNYLKNCGISPKHGTYLCPMRNNRLTKETYDIHFQFFYNMSQMQQ